jgi:serine/threonine protein kinase
VAELDPDVVSEGLGAFDEIERLGAGTFGTTFRVLRDDDEYAVKVIHLEGMPGYLWEREITALAAVDHPNVVGFRRAGVFEVDKREYPFLECEYIPGGSIKQNLEAGRRPSSEDELRALLTGLLAGVAEIHDLGIIHRDIKPANVALRDGDWGQPVLLDLGLAKVAEMSSHTFLGQFRGTPVYAAPEQLRGEPARQRSDLFAVGVVVYEAGTSEHPYRSDGVDSLQSMHDRIAEHTPTDPRQLADIWPEDVTDVVMHSLSYAAHQRYRVQRSLRLLEGPEAD